MAVIKPKDMHPFWVLSIFGQSYNNYQYSERLFRLPMEIEFKWKAVLIAYDLTDKQEKAIQEEHKDTTPRGRSYGIEIMQMAYLGFFLDAVYALTERISLVTKIFHVNRLKGDFEGQREILLQKPEINPDLSELMGKLVWYELFVEIRAQHAHCGTSILAFGYDRELQTGFSQLIMKVARRRENKILTGTSYKFDLRKTKGIKEGLEKFIQDWSLVLLKKLDLNATMLNVKGGLTLGKFMEGRTI